MKPNLGIVQYRDFQSFVIADIPGIIEGASEGKGLGHYFLRHIERNSVLLFLIPADSPNIVEEYHILLNELKKYNVELLDKQRIVAISKADLLDGELKELIENESLKKDSERFIEKSINKGFVDYAGAELDSILPPTSRSKGAREAKKQTVLQKIRNIVEIFIGI